MQQAQQQPQLLTPAQMVDNLKGQYAGELLGLSTDVQALKAAFVNRQIARSKRAPPDAQLATLSATDWGDTQLQHAAMKQLQQLVAGELLDPSATLPLSADAVHKKILAGNQAAAYRAAMATLNQPCLSRFVGLLAGQGLVECETLQLNGGSTLVISAIARQQLSQAAGVPDPLTAGQEQPLFDSGGPPAKRPRESDALEDLVNRKSTREREKLERGEELLELLDRKTAKQQAALEQFHMGGAAVQEPCQHVSKEACRAANASQYACNRLHKRKVVRPWTVESLGNCSFMDSCKSYRTCRYVHWEDDPETDAPGGQQALQGGRTVPQYLQALKEPQWINCDIRSFDWAVLGKFGVIMTDPPWHIRQNLPYGTMSDDELRGMKLGQLQDDGVIFMWVTGRALELGRELLHAWGYTRVDELIWVKINSLRRLIITGRTGHWLNHTKEHCLVGYKGRPHINRHIDCDVVVSEMRETSRKPDEMYPLLERLSPGTRKLEIFARQHNVRPGWVSLGNQLDGTRITEPDLLQRYTDRYGPPQRPR